MNYFIRLIYTLILTIIAPFYLLKLFKKKVGKPCVDSRWTEHFGFTPSLSTSENQEVIWIHAVSVGETLSVIPLIKQLHADSPEKKIIITTTTPTGAEQAQKISAIAEHRYMPLDFPFAIRGFLQSIKPSHLIIMETELWPNLLYIVKKSHIRISIINARLSEKSYRNYQKVKPLINLCLPLIDHIYCQHEEDSNRFQRLGAQTSQLSVTGSIKYDIEISKEIERKSVSLRHNIGSKRPVWIAASTHLGEDELLLENHKRILKEYPDALLILVPRHPERFNSVYDLCVKEGLSTQRRTQENTHDQPYQVYLGDTMGEMLTLMGAADICVMGGSFIGKAVGGHNVLEPASLGIPTITGPSYYNFRDITLSLHESSALLILDSADKIAPNIMTLLKNPNQLKHMSSQARNLVMNNAGALKKTVNMLLYS
ncbi:lipid IV(A) 3-deoxy-D-manno-octulosonic acid transferase [Vibrio gazogenes]|uniref:3-deoxy-D-manno-octulosonic acid transferase n=1 Tax=Vibrio gazogenes TaxID=687 RepID=A0A1Z2SFK7_VIBGA|nr:lipid IV(A) 3-deoxy-D-manno-octulosonic acid transferase [Vibrio gazogenes]ASA55946.1 3-deoxy-D-manno-octulosonic acid transferase [Vibrio gazogenes]